MWNNFTVDDEFCRIAAEQLREKLPPALHSYSDEEIVDNYKNLLE